MLEKPNLFLVDFIFVSLLLLLSIYLISFYFQADTLNTNYPDWMVHAFRIKSLETFGFSSWTHSWSNGISLWRSYQFIPHFIILLILKLFPVTVTKAMVLATIGAFIFLRLAIYTVLRLLKFSPLTALVGGILSFDIAQYWGGVSDYSLLFGFTFFPIIIYFWVQYFQGKLQHLFPYLVGLSFYVHPILGYTSFGLWATSVVFSSKKIFSISHFVQLLIFLTASSIFWVPLVFKTSYLYTSTVFANRYFLNLVISSYKYYGLSFFLLAALALSLIRVFMPIPGKFSWSRVLLIFVVGYFILVILGLKVDLPMALTQLQYTRGVTLIGIGIIFVFAAVLEQIIIVRSLAIKGAFILFLCLVVVEGFWFSSEYSPSGGHDFPEAVSTYIKNKPTKDISSGRVWASTIGLTSYYPPLTTRLPYSYMGQLDSNQISPRISPLILYQPYPDEIPTANMIRLNDYFKISGVRYIFFDEGSPFTKTLLSRESQIYKDLGEFSSQGSNFHLFEVPWQIKNAAIIDYQYKKDLAHFPFNLELTVINDQIELDNLVKRFASIIYKDENTPLKITYPSSDSILVNIPANRKSDLVYIDESFDKDWSAYFNNKKVSLESVGPNFTLATLSDNANQGLLYLKHTWPPVFYISLMLILLIPMEVLLNQILKSYLIKD